MKKQLPVNIFEVIATQGQEAIQIQLNQLSFEDLKTLGKHHTKLTATKYKNENNKQLIIDEIIKKGNSLLGIGKAFR